MRNAPHSFVGRGPLRVEIRVVFVTCGEDVEHGAAGHGQFALGVRAVEEVRRGPLPARQDLPLLGTLGAHWRGERGRRRVVRNGGVPELCFFFIDSSF